jgi:hypothetical protein
MYPGQFVIYENLLKDDYYNLLAESSVIFNCALQDWVSNTISEGDTLGAVPIYPAYRSFPETCLNMDQYLYIPWSVPSAVERILDVILRDLDIYQKTKGKISSYQDKTIERTIDIMRSVKGNASNSSPHYRGTLDKQFIGDTWYRSKVTETKQ